eukprot:3573995-Rhodomonas_salina.1
MAYGATRCLVLLQHIVLRDVRYCHSTSCYGMICLAVSLFSALPSTLSLDPSLFSPFFCVLSISQLSLPCEWIKFFSFHVLNPSRGRPAGDVRLQGKVTGPAVAVNQAVARKVDAVEQLKMATQEHFQSHRTHSNLTSVPEGPSTRHAAAARTVRTFARTQFEETAMELAHVVLAGQTNGFCMMEVASVTASLRLPSASIHTQEHNSEAEHSGTYTPQSIIQKQRTTTESLVRDGCGWVCSGNRTYCRRRTRWQACKSDVNTLLVEHRGFCRWISDDEGPEMSDVPSSRLISPRVALGSNVWHLYGLIMIIAFVPLLLVDLLAYFDSHKTEWAPGMCCTRNSRGSRLFGLIIIMTYPTTCEGQCPYGQFRSGFSCYSCQPCSPGFYRVGCGGYNSGSCVSCSTG